MLYWLRGTERAAIKHPSQSRYRVPDHNPLPDQHSMQRHCLLMQNLYNRYTEPRKQIVAPHRIPQCGPQSVRKGLIRCQATARTMMT